MRNLEARFLFLIFGVVPRKSRCVQELQYRQTKMSILLAVEFKISGLGQGGPSGVGGAVWETLVNSSCLHSANKVRGAVLWQC